jgi:hypothetical protein
MQNVQERTDIPQELKQPYFDPGTKWRWGFVPSAEIWNGRLAMIGFLFAIVIEVFSGQGFLHFWGLLGG